MAVRTDSFYGFLLFTDGAERTDKHVLVKEDPRLDGFTAIMWNVVDDDYVCYNYLRDLNNNTLSHVPEDLVNVAQTSAWVIDRIVEAEGPIELVFFAEMLERLSSGPRRRVWIKLKQDRPGWLNLTLIGQFEKWCSLAGFQL